MTKLQRRDFLRMSAAGAAALPLGCGGAADTPAADERPNVVLIMADDMGISDIGCYGGEIQTPNLDALAANGLRFKQFYNNARCCPTRASLMTGLYPHQTGVGHMMSDYGIPTYQGSINDKCVTIAEVMKSAGYVTLMSGKWHVTPPDEEHKPHWPRQRGFDRFFGTIHGAGSFYDPFSLTLENGPIKPESSEFYYTTAIAENAVRMIDEEAGKGKPFFLYMPFTSPHWPLHAPEDQVAKYKGRYDGGWDKLREERRARMIEIGLIDEDWALSPRDSDVPAWEDAPNKAWESRRMEVYAAQVDIMDQAIGQVLDKLRAMDALDNTLILFLADNGGCAEDLEPRDEVPPNVLHYPKETLEGEPVTFGNHTDLMPGGPADYQSYAIPWANASNTPFRRYKHWVHEGGISTPLIAHWPARMKQKGEWTEEYGQLMDIMATCADVGEAEYPVTFNGHEILPLEGRTLTPILDGGTRDPEHEIYWEHEGNRAVRKGKWKLVSKWSAPEKGRWELYDVEADRVELNDLAESMPEKVEELGAKWDAWAARAGVVEWKSWIKS